MKNIHLLGGAILCLLAGMATHGYPGAAITMFGIGLTVLVWDQWPRRKR